MNVRCRKIGGEEYVSVKDLELYFYKQLANVKKMNYTDQVEYQVIHTLETLIKNFENLR